MTADPPDDISCRSQVELAVMTGVHKNSITNWRRRGLLVGDPPYSLREWFLSLRRAGKLSDAKPSDPRARALRAWCFANGDASDPDDPAHDQPQGWKEEVERQEALRKMIARKTETIEHETVLGQRIPIELHRERLQILAQRVVEKSEGVLSVVANVQSSLPSDAKLSSLHRRVIIEALKKWIFEYRASLSNIMDKNK